MYLAKQERLILLLMYLLELLDRFTITCNVCEKKLNARSHVLQASRQDSQRTFGTQARFGNAAASRRCYFSLGDHDYEF